MVFDVNNNECKEVCSNGDHFCKYSTLRPRGTNFDLVFLLKLFCIVIDNCDLAHEDEILIFIKLRVARLMKANRVVVAMIVATAILVTPNILTNLVLAQTGTETQGTTNGGNTGGRTTGGGTRGTAADNESALYDEFQSCLESAAERNDGVCYGR